MTRKNRSSHATSPAGRALGLGFSALASYLAAQQAWVHVHLSRQNVRQTLSQDQNQLHTGLTYSNRRETPAYSVLHTIEDGIERITYTPAERRHAAPLLFAHGMWHGAWCWQFWQALFAAWGWESVAYSLPGHGRSPLQRPIRLCTLDYYLSFLKTEVARLETKPVLVGHSMGGALAQWYLKYVGDDLPAVVLAASWPHRVGFFEGLRTFFMADAWGLARMFASWSAAPFMRSPQNAARLLLNPQASQQAPIRPEELYVQLAPESMLVLMQYLDRYWQAPQKVRTPLLVVAGESDVLVYVEQLGRTAGHYQADFFVAEESGHNVQMDHNYLETAQRIERWLLAEKVQ